jgi:SAM-dependent methyltransferase
MMDEHRIYPGDAFSRQDESDDAVFYSRDRFVEHLDATALATIENLIDQLIGKNGPAILDLMASWNSHIPATVRFSRLAGLGLNEKELIENKKLTERIVHDINRYPELPCANETFDAVICTASVDYLTHPIAVFQEVGRILKPGGLFLVFFSNRFFPPKVVKIWRDSTEEERVMLVQDFFNITQMFDEPGVFTSRGKPRPKSDKYAHLGIPSDPVYAVYAAKKGGAPKKQIIVDKPPMQYPTDEAEIEKNKKMIKDTLVCPYCGTKLKKWRVPQTPFTEWPNEFQYICFNDECAYFVRGWDSMESQGNPGSYRLMYNPLTDSCHPIPVFNHLTLRDGIEDDE